MAVKKKLKLKPAYINALKTIGKILGTILAIILAVFLFYRYEINSIKKLGYSEEASQQILFKFKKKYVSSITYSKTLDTAFRSKDFSEKYMKKYEHIDYHKGEHFIKNINTLLSKKYSYNDINMIFSHGTDSDVLEFSKRDRVNYVEEYYTYDFAKLSNYDKYVKHSEEYGENAYVTVVRVNLMLDEEEYKNPNIVDTFSTDMLVNKHFRLDDKFKVDDLVTIPADMASEGGLKLQKEAFEAYKKMSEDATKNGYSLYINTAYRSHNDQQKLCDLYTKTYGPDYTKKYVAYPGYSEHETGLAIDVASKNSNVFANSKEYLWMIDNAYKYGYILRYTNQFVSDTGFRSEAWHYRYVGKEISKYLHEHKVSFEEYYAVFIDK